MSSKQNDITSKPRSAGALTVQRIKQPWPKNRDFHILSIDGGGIKGIFPASILAQLEERIGTDKTIAKYFDLITGTSTGGIIALGLGKGLSAKSLLQLYTNRGNEIFPPTFNGCLGHFIRWLRSLLQLALYLYKPKALRKVLQDTLGDSLLGESNKRLCIPAFEARHSEVCVYKTPHHTDYKMDLHKGMVDIGMATAAAPGFFRPVDHDGHTLVDGGVWANNPIMIAVVEALTAFDVQPNQIKVLSISCGDEPYRVNWFQKHLGGFFYWRKIIDAAIRLQSLNATNQARLLLSPQNVIRIDPPSFKPAIDLDDWTRAKDLLPNAANDALNPDLVERISNIFLSQEADPYIAHLPDDFKKDK